VNRIRPVSKKRASQAAARDACRLEVLSRDRRCRGHGVAPVDCAVTASEMHELGRGAYRQSCWLNPQLCIGLCRNCHRWVTEHPTAAKELGLAMAGWEVEQFLAAAGEACH